MHRIGVNNRSWYYAVFGVAVLIVVPIVALLFSLFGAPSEALRFLWHNRLPQNILTSLFLCVSVGCATLIIGSGCAWVVTRYRFVGSRIVEFLLILPLALPAYIGAYCFQALVDTILVPGALLLNGSTNAPVWNINGLFGSFYVLTLSLYPYIYIIARVIFQNESRIYFEVAHVQGIKAPFLKVGIPLARPALIGGVALVSMEVLNEYGTLVYFGVETLTTAIFRIWFDYNDLRGAAQLATYMLAVLFVIAYIELKSRKQAQFTNTVLHNASIPKKRVRGVRSVLLCAVCALPIIGGLILPLSSLLYWSIAKSSALFLAAPLWVSFGNSVFLALVTAVICLAVSLFLSFGRRIHATKFLRFTILISSFGYAIPGAIIAVGIMRSFGVLLVFGSLALLFFAYTVRYFAVCYHPLEAAIAKDCTITDNVARTLGASHWRRLFSITVPQIRLPIIGVSILIFLDILKELPLTIILRPLGFETLALQTFYYSSEEQLAFAAPSAILILLIGIISIILMQRNIYGKK